jgi:hypothetical protein
MGHQKAPRGAFRVSPASLAARRAGPCGGHGTRPIFFRAGRASLSLPQPLGALRCGPNLLFKQSEITKMNARYRFLPILLAGVLGILDGSASFGQGS